MRWRGSLCVPSGQTRAPGWPCRAVAGYVGPGTEGPVSSAKGRAERGRVLPILTRRDGACAGGGVPRAGHPGSARPPPRSPAQGATSGPAPTPVSDAGICNQSLAGIGYTSCRSPQITPLTLLGHWPLAGRPAGTRRPAQGGPSWPASEGVPLGTGAGGAGNQSSPCVGDPAEVGTHCPTPARAGAPTPPCREDKHRGQTAAVAKPHVFPRHRYRLVRVSAVSPGGRGVPSAPVLAPHQGTAPQHPHLVGGDSTPRPAPLFPREGTDHF